MEVVEEATALYEFVGEVLAHFIVRGCWRGVVMIMVLQ